MFVYNSICVFKGKGISVSVMINLTYTWFKFLNQQFYKFKVFKLLHDSKVNNDLLMTPLPPVSLLSYHSGHCFNIGNKIGG